MNPYYCAGYVHGSSVGWIQLGTGVPQNGFMYRNDSASDFGVNVLSSGELRGFAYGANIGWISFTAAGNPRIDWGSGKLTGAAWSANAGWISLSDSSTYLRVETLPQLPDLDGDDLPDAWEILNTGGLARLEGAADSDGDGQTDRDEYLAGTNPSDPADRLGPVRLTVTPGEKELTFPTKAHHTYQVQQHPALGSGIWRAAPVGRVAGSGSVMTVKLPDDSEEVLFYRIVGYPPLTSFE